MIGAIHAEVNTVMLRSNAFAIEVHHGVSSKKKIEPRIGPLSEPLTYSFDSL